MWPGRKKTDDDNIYNSKYKEEVEEITREIIITFAGGTEYALDDISLEETSKFEEWIKNEENKSIYIFTNVDDSKTYVRKEQIIYVEIL